MRNLLVIGTLPPPIGGVSVHVERLLEVLRKNDFDFDFCTLTESLNLFRTLRYRLIHIHCSNVYWKFLLSFFCFICRKRLIVTYHGDIDRSSWIKRRFNCWSIYFAYIPVVLNERSFQKAVKINKRTRLISAFIPPQHDDALPESIVKLLQRLKTDYARICSTNAFAMKFEQGHKEIYGILPLIELFRNRPADTLVISDPSGDYGRHVKNSGLDIPDNVELISCPHSYYALLGYVDCMIRNTTTDGDAISIKEALYIGKSVYATDVVSRHPSVKTYSTIDELNALLDSSVGDSVVADGLSGVKDLLSLYKSHL